MEVILGIKGHYEDSSQCVRVYKVRLIFSPIVDLQFVAASCELWAVSCGLWAVGCELW
jgi:hypothetical protein